MDAREAHRRTTEQLDAGNAQGALVPLWALLSRSHRTDEELRTGLALADRAYTALGRRRAVTTLRMFRGELAGAQSLAKDAPLDRHRLQRMAKASQSIAGEGGSGEGGSWQHVDILDGEEGENWTRANLLLDTVEELELIGPTVQPTELLIRLFHEEGPRVFDAQPVRFGCTCSPDKVRQSLSIYSAKDIATMTTDAGIVTADCQFCGAHYEFDPATLGFEAKGEEGARA